MIFRHIYITQTHNKQTKSAAGRVNSIKSELEQGFTDPFPFPIEREREREDIEE
jgi:hypothetical protein